MEQSVIAIMKQRFSCRICADKEIAEPDRRQLAEFLAGCSAGPFGNRPRMALVAAGDDAPGALKGLGTYGFIKGARGYIVGAVGPGPKNLEDFGYLMEYAILFATGLGLGTCWLGGSFTKSSFARKIGAAKPEIVPAVTSVGYSAEQGKEKDWIRRRAGGAARMPAAKLFFDGAFGTPLDPATAGAYAEALEMVRWAPSASNKQPWRIVRHGGCWHFYLERTKGYGKDSFLGRLLGVADLQRVDMGIALCHFELAAGELGLTGRWEIKEPDIGKPDGLTEYTASWRGER